MYFIYILTLNWRPLRIECRVGTSRVILLFEFGRAPAVDGQGLREELVILSHRPRPLKRVVDVGISKHF